MLLCVGRWKATSSCRSPCSSTPKTAQPFCRLRPLFRRPPPLQRSSRTNTRFFFPSSHATARLFLLRRSGRILKIPTALRQAPEKQSNRTMIWTRRFRYFPEIIGYRSVSNQAAVLANLDASQSIELKLRYQLRCHVHRVHVSLGLKIVILSFERFRENEITHEFFGVWLQSQPCLQWTSDTITDAYLRRDLYGSNGSSVECSSQTERFVIDVITGFRCSKGPRYCRYRITEIRGPPI